MKGESCLMNNIPLLERTIRSAKSSKFITDIVVATDSQETQSLAKSLGVESPFIRPDELSETYIDVLEIITYTLDWLEQSNRNYDLVVLLEEIYPFRPDTIIDEMIEKLISEGYDTVFAGMTEMRGIIRESMNKIELLESEASLTMPKALKDSQNIIGLLGLCCVMHVASLRNNNAFSGKVGVVKMNDPCSVISVRNGKELELASLIDKNL